MTWLGGLALVRFLPWSHHCHQNCHIKRKSSTLSHASGWDLRRIWAGPHPEIIERPWDSPHPLFSSQKLSFVNKELFFFFLSFDHLTSSFSLFPCLLPRSVPVVLSDRACLPTDNGNSSDRVEFPWGVLNQTLGPIGAQKGKPANYSSSHGGSCCLSPSICGHRESADRPVCFYLPTISIQGDEACQGFTGTGNVSLAPGVSVV